MPPSTIPVSKNGEDCDSSKKRRPTVCEADDKGILQCVVVHVVVAGVSDQTTECQTEGEEDLSGSLHPHDGICKLRKLKSELIKMI